MTLDLDLGGNTLAVDLVENVCEEPDEIYVQTAVYEWAPFHLVEPVDGPVVSEGPEAGDAPGPAGLTTSNERFALQVKGTVEGAELGYFEYQPPDYTDAGPSPLIVFLHGSGESGAGDGFALAKLSAAALSQLQPCTSPATVDARLTIYPFTGHDSWTKTYNGSAGHDIYSWFLSHTKD